MDYIHWNPQIELFSFFGYPIRWYGLLWAIGLIGAYNIVKYLCKTNKNENVKVDQLFLYSIIGIFAGARLGHCLFYDYEYFFSSPKHIIEIFIPIRFLVNGDWIYTGYAGLASHGGVIGLIIALWYYCKHNKIKTLYVLDCIAIAAPFTAMMIRLGNLMNSEIIGRPTNVPWAFIFDRVDSVPRHPAQLYEALFYLIVFVIGVILYRQTRLHKSLGHGFFFGYCIVTIFTFRFFIEFVKEVQVDFEHSMALDMGQWLSIPLVLLGSFFVYKSLTYKYSTNYVENP